MSNKMFKKNCLKKIKKFMKNYVHFLKIWYNNNINKRKTPRREKKMVEYKVTGKNKIECAKDYVENHIGEEIHFLNNDTHCSGWLNHKSKCTNENIWKSDEEMFSLYYTINEIANAMYRLSHTK